MTNRQPPPSIEYLQGLDNLICYRKCLYFQLPEYVFTNSQDERIFTLDSYTTGCLFVRRHYRLLDSSQTEIIHFAETSSLVRLGLDIFYPLGQLLGTIYFKKAWREFSYTVEYGTHGTVFWIRQDGFERFYRHPNYSFSIFDQQNEKIGELRKVFRSREGAKYEITFPSHLKTNLKILIMAACLHMVNHIEIG